MAEKRKNNVGLNTLKPGEKGRIAGMALGKGIGEKLQDMGFFAEDPERRVESVIGTRIPKDGSWRNGFFMGNCAQARAEGKRFIRGCAPSALDAANEVLRCFQIEESPDV